MSDKNGSVPKEKYRAIMMFSERGTYLFHRKTGGQENSCFRVNGSSTSEATKSITGFMAIYG